MAGTESSAGARRLCGGADGPPRGSALRPSVLICRPSPRSRGSRRRTFGVFVLASPGVVGFLRRSLDSVELFSTRPVCCAAPVLLCTGPVSSTEGCILESCCQEVQLTGSFFVCGLKSL